jgi:hypothetical protein
MAKKTQTTGKKSGKKAKREAPVVVEESIEAPEGTEAAYLQVRAAAQPIPLAEARAFQGDLDLAWHNAQIGMAAVLAEEATAGRIPNLSLAEIRTIPTVIEALKHLDARIIKQKNLKAELPALRKTVARLRHDLLLAADALVGAGIFPAERVKKIRAGSGLLDMAQDCLDLAALFREFRKETKGKTAVTPEQLADADLKGRMLRNIVQPKGALNAPAAAPSELETDRARLGTRLDQLHDQLWRAGAVLFGRRLVDEKVPALLAHHRPHRKAPAAPAPGGTPATDPGKSGG